jgi:protocatechuate 3,4-dioxygenase beta subunit
MVENRNVMKSLPLLSRRRLVTGGITLAGWTALTGAGGVLVPTPRQSAGPFYPDKMPLDSDADLVSVAGRGAPAKGDITHLFGRVLDRGGKPVAGARVEIWQCDANGRYIHSRDAARGGGDPNFQGYGRTDADGDGGYRFRTIRPVPYTGRTPHIHIAVTAAGHPQLVSQLYVAGEPMNEGDFLYNRIRDPQQRAAVTIALESRPDIEAGALAMPADIVLPA